MAVTYHKSSRTIRGVTYNYGDTFVCYTTDDGTSDSEGAGSSRDITKGATYYYLGYSWDDDNNKLASYPYAVGTTSSGVHGWFRENVFPYATYKVTYNANGGSGAPSSQTKTYGVALTLSSTKPTRSGYTFKGWALSKANADNGTWYYQAGGTCGKNENLTLYAVWDANSYTYNIVYKSSSGVQLGTNTATYDFGTTNTISPKSYTGYTSPNSQSVSWNSTSAKTITFTYTPISYNVNINCNGGSGVSSRTYTIETTTFSLSTPTRTGYTFSGWTGSNGSTPQKTVSISKGSTGNKSYNANWSENKLTVNYYSNYATSFNGNVTPLNTVNKNNVLIWKQDFYYDNAYPDALISYKNYGSDLYMTRIGYVATDNWSTSIDGGTLIHSDDDFETGQVLAQKLGKSLANGNASVNVYAEWKLSSVAYIENGTSFEPYLAYIDDGANWNLYLMYVDDGANWNIIS